MFSSLAKGIKGPLQGLSFINRNPKLAIYLIIPFTITAAIYFTLFYLLFTNAELIMGWVTGFISWQPAEESGIIGAVKYGLWQSIRWFIVLLIYISVIVLSILFFTATANLIASPFYDIVSEKVEAILTGKKSPPFNMREFVRSSIVLLASMAKRYLLLVLLILFSLLLQLIPIFGSLAAFLIASFIYVDEYFDYPMSRHEIPIGKRYKYFLKNFFHSLGFGGAAVGFLFIPLFGLIVIPGNVVYATIRFVEDYKPKYLDNKEKPIAPKEEGAAVESRSEEQNV